MLGERLFHSRGNGRIIIDYKNFGGKVFSSAQMKISDLIVLIVTQWQEFPVNTLATPKAHHVPLDLVISKNSGD
jgi:hypothetical protein